MSMDSVSDLKANRLETLRVAIMQQVSMAASEVGGLTYSESDEWWDVLQDAVSCGFEGAITDA